MIVNFAARRRARAEELLIEAQVVARHHGIHDVADLVRAACVLLTTPPSTSGALAPITPIRRVIAVAMKEAA